MSDIIQNEDTGAFGFRIRRKPAKGDTLDPILEQLIAIRRYCRNNLDPESWYEFSHYGEHLTDDGVGLYMTYDFWFENRETALLVKLTA